MSLVSVIIPVYNSEKHLAETINSCLQQGPVVKEIILVNDGSTDNSPAIMQEFYCKYPRLIRLIDNRRKGAPSARNTGIAVSRGKYIQFLDADDILGPNKIESQFKLLEQSDKNQVASCSWFHFDEYPSDAIRKRQFIDRDYPNPLNWLKDSWNGNGMGQTAIWLTPKYLIDKVGGFDESLEMNQDGDYFSRILMESSGIRYNPNVEVFYRIPAVNNISQRKNLSAIFSLLRSFHGYERILNISDTIEIRSALNQNYLDFTYHYYNRYPELARRAIEYSRELGFGVFRWKEKGLFHVLSKFLGYKPAFFLRKMLKGV